MGQDGASTLLQQLNGESDSEVTVPDLVGEKYERALYEELKNSGFLVKPEGSGDYIVSQSLQPGTLVERGTALNLRLAKSNVASLDELYLTTATGIFTGKKYYPEPAVTEGIAEYKIYVDGYTNLTFWNISCKAKNNGRVTNITPVKLSSIDRKTWTFNIISEDGTATSRYTVTAIQRGDSSDKLVVPNLVGRKYGQSLYEEVKSKGFAIRNAGSGEYIVDQTPKAGTLVEKGTTINVTLGKGYIAGLDELYLLLDNEKYYPEPQVTEGITEYTIYINSNIDLNLGKLVCTAKNNGKVSSIAQVKLIAGDRKMWTFTIFSEDGSRACSYTVTADKSRRSGEKLTVPNLAGRKYDQSLYEEIKGMGLVARTEGNGGYVINQSIKPGMLVEKGTTINLLLGKSYIAGLEELYLTSEEDLMAGKKFYPEPSLTEESLNYTIYVDKDSSATRWKIACKAKDDGQIINFTEELFKDGNSKRWTFTILSEDGSRGRKYTVTAVKR